MSNSDNVHYVRLEKRPREGKSPTRPRSQTQLLASSSGRGQLQTRLRSP